MNFRSPKYLLLLLLPLVYFYFTGVVFLPWRPFYTLGPDPIYIYLFNGMTFAGGHFKITYIDNPGIPVQCFCGIVIFIKHLFNPGIPLYQDVLLHPESYIYTLCTTVALMYVLATLYTGYYVFKRTGNLALALLFQLTPLIDRDGILTTGAPTPESFYIIWGMLFMAYIYCNTIFPKSRMNGETGLRQAIIYGVFTAFMVACKYICFPLFFLVLFIMPTRRLIIRYVIACGVFLFIFMLPSLSAWRSIQQWLFNLATHTGQYGQGESGFINSAEYFPNLVAIFKEDRYFTAFYILLILALIVAYAKRKQANEKSKPYIRLLYGVGVSSALLILLVAKHYSFHYLIPVRLCYPLIIACSYEIFKNNSGIKIVKNKLITNTLFYVFYIFLIYTQLKMFASYPPKLRPPATADFLKKYTNEPIIMAADFESSRMEPALSMGTAYTGDYRNHYWEFLKKIYPNFYQYKYPQEAIEHWDDILYPPELIAKYPKTVIYFIKKDSNTRNAILNHLTMWGKDTIAHVQLVYSMSKTNEYVYELQGNPDAAKALMNKWTEIYFDLEKLTPDKSKFISTDGKDTASGTDRISDKEHHSGDKSILMNWENQYALNVNIRAFPGNMVVANIWRKSNDGNGVIVLTSRTAGDFYISGQTAIDSNANGWKQIQYKCLVPTSVKDSTVYFYLYYYGHGYAYFDDLSVRVYKMQR